MSAVARSQMPLRAMIEARLMSRLHSDPDVKARLPRLQAAVAEGRLSAAIAADEIAQALGA